MQVMWAWGLWPLLVIKLTMYYSEKFMCLQRRQSSIGYHLLLIGKLTVDLSHINIIYKFESLF